MNKKVLIGGSESERMNLKEQIAFCEQNPDRAEGLFYDWFCSEKSLPRKAAGLLAKVRRVVNGGKFDPEKVYVFFKNNCPCGGILYDDFRICDLKTQEVIFTVVPKSGHRGDNGRAEVWARKDGGAEFDFEVKFEGTWSGVVDWFNPAKAQAKAAKVAAAAVKAAAIEAEIADRKATAAHYAVGI